MIKKVAAFFLATGLILAGLSVFSACQTEKTEEDAYGSLSGTYTRAENCGFFAEEIIFSEDGICDIQFWGKAPYIYNATQGCVELCIEDAISYSFLIDVNIQAGTFGNYDMSSLPPVATYTVVSKYDIGYNKVSIYDNGFALAVGEQVSFVVGYIRNKQGLIIFENQYFIEGDKIYLLDFQGAIADYHDSFNNENTLRFTFIDESGERKEDYYFYDNGFYGDGFYTLVDIYPENPELKIFGNNAVLYFDYVQMTCQLYVPQGEPVTEWVADDGSVFRFYENGVVSFNGVCFLDCSYRIVETCGNKYLGLAGLWLKVGEGNTVTRIDG